MENKNLNKSDTDQTMSDIDELEAHEQRKKRTLATLLDESLKKDGHYAALKSEMGYANQEDSETLVPSYSVVHTLRYIGNKAHMKMGSEMPFMSTHIDHKTGRVIIDEHNVDLIAQRAPDWTRQPSLTAYLLHDKNHKFSTILSVVSPSWIDNPKHENWGPDERAMKSAIEFIPLDSEGNIGLIRLNDTDAYALDGQHRVMGIRGLIDLNEGRLEIRRQDGSATGKEFTKNQFLEDHNTDITALQNIFEEKISVEYIPAVIKGETAIEARRRLRSIFVSINKYARTVAKGEAITLDENDGFAIVSRKAGINHRLFTGNKNPINWKSTTIADRSLYITTAQALKDMVSIYIEEAHGEISDNLKPKIKGAVPIRPSDKTLEKVENIFYSLLDKIYELDVFRRINSGDNIVQVRNFYSKLNINYEGHLLLRPIGQTILFRAIGKIIKKGKMSLEEIFTKLNKLDTEKGFRQQDHSNVWYIVTFDPIGRGRMIVSNQRLAADLLAYLIEGAESDKREELESKVKKLRSNDAGTNWINFDGKEVYINDETNGSKFPLTIR